ncbi:MAG TPA: peptidase M18 [Thermoanaerobaculia bacterium]|nr:peptidase M18 [Thermoanaerobaculia bacterium]
MRKVWIAFLVCWIAATLAAQDAKKPAGSVWDNRLSGWEQLQPGQKDEVFKFAEGYKSYLNVSRSALTSTKEVLRLAKAAGFSEFTDAAQVKPGARLIANAHDRALVLIVVGSDSLISGSRLVGTHHDSPHIDLKARPIYTSNGYTLFKTIYYGGIKKYQWANRPLALIGRIDTTDGKRVDVAIGLKDGDPVFVIPDNAPHSDNEGIRNRKAEDVFGGEELDPVVGSIPGKGDSVTAEVLAALTSTYGIREEDFVSAELQLVPNAVPADVGIDRGLVGAYGQDDRLSSYCAARAVMDIKGTPKHTAMAYLSNFEEVGSVNNSGARSQFMNSTYARLLGAQRGKSYTDLDLREALRNAEVVSADTNDGINPVFPQTSEPSGAARLGFGATIKRYGAGFDANSEFIAKIRGLLEKNHIAWQTQTPKVDGYSGGTIGGFLSMQEMEVIDMGVPLLSMHSTFEMSSKVDVWSFYRFMSVFLSS